MFHYRLDHISEGPHNSKTGPCFPPKQLNTQTFQKIRFEPVRVPNGSNKGLVLFSIRIMTTDTRLNFLKN